MSSLRSCVPAAVTNNIIFITPNKTAVEQSQIKDLPTGGRTWRVYQRSGGTVQVRGSEPLLWGLGLNAPLKPFVHFHTKDGLTVKDLTDSQCLRLIAFAVKTTAVPTFVQWEGLPPGYASAVGYYNKNKYSGGS